MAKKAALTETEKAKKAAESAAKHKQMLSKLASVRVPRVVQAILSIGALAVHNPTKTQADAIMATINTAAKKTQDRLNGQSETKPSFKLPE